MKSAIVATKSNPSEWFVIRTSANAEAKVGDRLSQNGYEVFYPTYTSIRVWSDRKKKIQVPLITTTLFVKCTPEELMNCYSISGVISVLKFLGKPAVVKQWEIDNLRILLQQDDFDQLLMDDVSFSIGEAVRVTKGAFKGLMGTSIEIEGKHKLKITIDSIGAAFSVSIPKSFVSKIEYQKVA